MKFSIPSLDGFTEQHYDDYESTWIVKLFRSHHDQVKIVVTIRCFYAVTSRFRVDDLSESTKLFKFDIDGGPTGHSVSADLDIVNFPSTFILFRLARVYPDSDDSSDDE